MTSQPRFLDEREWQGLLREIHRGQVIPVVGPALVTVDDQETGETVPLIRYLAPQLADELGLGPPGPDETVSHVARQFLLSGGKRRELYISIATIVERLRLNPGAGLVDLAKITDFQLFICSTFDSMLVQALQTVRPGFLATQGVIRYHYKGNPGRPGETPLSGNPASPCDLPATFTGPVVYHILGDYQTQPDFAVWEEDYMEFICGLIQNRDTLKNLFQNLSGRNLLLLGAPSQDWIVRFFLRAAYGERLSDRDQVGYLADRTDRMDEAMILFLDKLVKGTRIIGGNPSDFVRELSARWSDMYGVQESPDEFLRRQPETLPRGSVFISYSHDDIGPALRVAQSLAAAGVPVWLDKQRLQTGNNYETQLEHAIKFQASYFLSLISANTERDPSRYVHKERGWAAQKHVDGFVYYLPLIIDDVREVRHEPSCFAKIHRERLSDASLPKFTQRMAHLLEQFRLGGYPRA
jgi:hypothetical protein